MIEIYGTPTCGFCRRAKLLAERYGITTEYKDITFEKFEQELKERADFEYKTVPQIWWNNRYIGGYNELATEIENTRNFGDGAF
jgi:glutaredoxin 3